MATVYGYGVDLSKLSFTDEEAMKNFIKKYLPDEVENMEENINENGMDVFEWIDNYDNGFGYHGLSAMLADIINKREGVEFSAYDSIRNGCIYISANYPWHFNEKEKQLTSASFSDIICKYLSQITSDVIACESLDLYFESLD